MIECTIFVYKHVLCANRGELLIGDNNNGYEIVYAPPKTKDIQHRLTIDWDTISGLKRVNKKMDNNADTIHLMEQLIIESKSYPKLHILQYNHSTNEYETQSMQVLRTHYIGLEYDITHSSEINMPLLQCYPNYYLLYNESLPEWVWIPLLTHNLRVLIQKIMLFSNIALFIWTMYQITKYTSVIQQLYHYIFYPLFAYISQTMLKKIYYFLNLVQFNVVIHFVSTIFSVFYNYIPVNAMYQCFAAFDQHILQQIFAIFQMFSRLCTALFGLFSPLFRFIFAILKHFANVFTYFNCFKHCHLCNKMCVCNGRCMKVVSYVWKLKDSKVIKDSNKILKVGVEGMKSMNSPNRANLNNAGLIRYVWNNLKSIIDVFWIGIGKPIKHIYDFFKYVRSEVGSVVAKCLKKCCKKSTEKVKNAILTPKAKEKCL